MEYVIVTIKWCLERGIIIPEHARKSIDGSKVILHKEYIQPVLGKSIIESYNHNSTELSDILNSAEWSEPIEEEYEFNTES